MTELEEKKSKNIIVLTDFSEYGDAAVCYGAKLAKIFDSQLTIIHRIKGKLDRGEEISTFFSEQYKNTVQKMSVEGIHYNLSSEIFALKDLYEYAEAQETILFVIAVAPQKNQSLFTRKQAVKFIKPSRIPVMVVGNQLPDEHTFEQVMLPIDAGRQSKDKALWAGYFSRFNGSTVHIIHTTYNDASLDKRAGDILTFIEKLYGNLEVTYELHNITPTVDNIDKFSLEFAPKIDATLSVIMMTKYYSLIDLLFGPKEYSLIGNELNFPVLCINDRDDLCMLCM